MGDPRGQTLPRPDGNSSSGHSPMGSTDAKAINHHPKHTTGEKLKKPLALLGVSALVGLGALLISGPAQAEVAVDENPCNVQGWYVNQDETDREPAFTSDGFKFEDADLIHHASSVSLADLTHGTFEVVSTSPDQDSFFSVELRDSNGAYGTLRWNTTTSKWDITTSGPAGGQFSFNTAAEVVGTVSKWGTFTENTKAVSFGVGYTKNPPGTKTVVVKSITFHGTTYNLSCKLATPVEATLDPKATCDKVAVVKLPVTEGVKYTKSDAVEGKVTVTATAESGYYFKKDTKTSWEFDVSKLSGPTNCPTPSASPSTTAAPTTTTSPASGGLPVTGDSNGKKIAAAGGLAIVVGAIAAVVARRRRETKFIAE